MANPVKSGDMDAWLAYASLLVDAAERSDGAEAKALIERYEESLREIDRALADRDHD